MQSKKDVNFSATSGSIWPVLSSPLQTMLSSRVVFHWGSCGSVVMLVHVGSIGRRLLLNKVCLSG